MPHWLKFAGLVLWISLVQATIWSSISTPTALSQDEDSVCSTLQVRWTYNWWHSESYQMKATRQTRHPVLCKTRREFTNLTCTCLYCCFLVQTFHGFIQLTHWDTMPQCNTDTLPRHIMWFRVGLSLFYPLVQYQCWAPGRVTTRTNI